MAAKGPQAFRAISEAADELGVPQHVLRFWETRFSFIRPMKRAGGRRFYRPHDIIVLAGVRALLHRDSMSIKSVQALYKEEGIKRIIAAAEPQALPAPAPAPVPAPAPEPVLARPAVARPPMAPIQPQTYEPYTDDLFDSPSISPRPATRPRLSPIGRARLGDSLSELERMKVRLDRLLKPS